MLITLLDYLILLFGIANVLLTSYLTDKYIIK